MLKSAPYFTLNSSHFSSKRGARLGLWKRSTRCPPPCDNKFVLVKVAMADNAWCNG